MVVQVLAVNRVVYQDGVRGADKRVGRYAEDARHDDETLHRGAEHGGGDGHDGHEEVCQGSHGALLVSLPLAIDSGMIHSTG